ARFRMPLEDLGFYVVLEKEAWRPFEINRVQGSLQEVADNQVVGFLGQERSGPVVDRRVEMLGDVERKRRSEVPGHRREEAWAAPTHFAFRHGFEAYAEITHLRKVWLISGVAVAQVGDVVPAGQMAKNVERTDRAAGVSREQRPVLNEKDFH